MNAKYATSLAEEEGRNMLEINEKMYSMLSKIIVEHSI